MEQEKTYKQMTINVDDDYDENYLLTSPLETRQQGIVKTVYGTVEVETKSKNLNFSGDVVPLLRKERGKSGKKKPKPGSEEFPAARARMVLLIVLMLHRISETSGTIDSQYFYARYNAMFFNGSVSMSGTLTQSTCITNSSDPNKALDDALQQSLSRFQMYLSYVSIGPMFVSVIFFGALSDVVGRRLLILLPLVTGVITHAVMLVIMHFELDLHYCYANSVIGGATGSGYLLLIGVFAYTADLTPASNISNTRTFAIVVVEFVSAISGVVGQIVIGYMIEYFGYFYSSVMPFCFKLVTVYLAVYFLPETLPEQVRGIRPGCINPIRYLKNIFGFYLAGSKRERARFCLCLVTLFSIFVVALKHGSVFTLFELDEPFCWNSVQIGYYSAITSGVKHTLGLIGLRILQRFFSEAVILIVGLISLSAQFMLEGVADNTFMLYLAAGVGTISSTAVGINRGMLSGMAGSERQGALFASIAVVETCSDFLSNTLYNTLWGATVSFMRGAVFIIMGGVNGIGIIFMLIFIKLSPPPGELPVKYEKIISPDTLDEVSKGKENTTI